MSVQILSAFEYLDADCMREATRYGILFETKDGLSCPHNCLQILSAFEYLDADCMHVATRYGVRNPLAPESGEFKEARSKKKLRRQ